MSGDSSRFGKYRLLQRIGTGGMGEVHLAKLIGPSGFEKLVVIKRLLESRQSEKKYIEMFFREANVAAQLSHGNIVQVYEVDQNDGVHYIAMEYVAGKSLRRLIDRCYEQNKKLPLAYVVEIMSELCTGLSFAHNARNISGAPLGLIHRDINPHNVLISYRGEVKIIDFGIAKSELTLDKTQAGTIKGTVVYMSPEQSSGHKLDKRSDLFAVGICLYEALTNHNPFHKESLGASLEAIRKAELPPLTPELQPFAEILQRALARIPDERYSDCSELADALQALSETGVIARPTIPLAKFVSDMFVDDIIEEERLLSQTELQEMPHMNAITSTVSGLEGAKTEISLEDESKRFAWGEENEPGFVGALKRLIKSVLPPFLRDPMLRLWHYPAVRMGCAGLLIMAGSLGLYMQARKPPDDVQLAEAATDAKGAAPVLEEPNNVAPPAPTPTFTPPVQTAPAAPSPAPAAATVPPTAIAQRHTAHKKPNKRHVEAAVNESPSVGNVQVILDPPSHVMNNGASEGRSFHLHSASGTLQIGVVGDPYVIKVHYRVENKEISYTVESEPWANVSGAGGITLGRTPLENVQGGNTTVFEFSNPKLDTSQRVTIRFSNP